MASTSKCMRNTAGVATPGYPQLHRGAEMSRLARVAIGVVGDGFREWECTWWLMAPALAGDVPWGRKEGEP